MASRAFSLDMTLLVRASSGWGDSWNQPYETLTRVPVKGYFWQDETGDPTRGGDVTWETLRAAFLPPTDVAPQAFHRLEFDLDGDTFLWEIAGEPEPKFSMARGGKLHHYEVRLERAEA